MITRKNRRWTAIVAIMSSLLAAVDAIAADVSLYTHSRTLVTVEGGRRLNMICIGTGSPVVIMEAGLGDGSLTWASVQGEIAAVTTVCAYDRAGYGFSDPATRPSNAANNADDLQRLLTASGLKPPFVLTAHSLGGLYATLFASQHRDEIAGMVLVDPSFSEQNREISELSTPQQRTGSNERLRRYIERCEKCIALARQNALSDATTNPPDCLPIIPDPVLNIENRRQNRRAQTQEVILSEILSISSFNDDKRSDDSRAMDAASHDLGAIPLIVLTRGIPTTPPAFFDVATQRKIDAAWKAGHDRLAAFSSNGKSIIVPDAKHYIQQDQPQAVIQAVLDVVHAVKTNTKL